MKLVIASLLSVVVLAGCNTPKPPTCDSEAAVQSVQNIIRSATGTTETLNVNVISTVSVDQQTGNHTCTATVTHEIAPSTFEFWEKAGAVLVHTRIESRNMPQTPFLPNHKTLRAHVEADVDMDYVATMMLLSQTDFFDEIRSYVEDTFRDPRMPSYMYAMRNAVAVIQFHDGLEIIEDAFDTLFEPTTMQVRYTTRLATVDGKQKPFVEVVNTPPQIERIRTMSAVTRMAEKIVGSI